ncbi:ankyrin repeat-containing domain protein [Cunninghamella echinulata]|nr:ankyrin repeat-containing domain protein [Cunninghamella echinulata]
MANNSFPSPPSSPIQTKRKRELLPSIITTTAPLKRTKTNTTALDITVLKEYVERGGSMMIEKNGKCLLCCACQCHSMEALTYLLKKENTSLSIQHVCQNDMTVLHSAAYYGFIDGLKFLLNHSSNITNYKTKKDMKTPLHYAIQTNQIDCVRYLLEKGARLDLPDALGRLPIHIAIMNRQLECVALLLDYQHLSKNNPSHTDIIWGSKFTSLPTATLYETRNAVEDAIMMGCPSILKSLLSSSSFTIDSISSPSTLLDLAVQWNRIECLELLTQNGYQVNESKEKDGTSSLLLKAVQQRKVDMVQVLYRHGAINTSQQGFSPSLLYAANHGFLEMVPYLISRHTSNDCIQQAIILSTPLNLRQPLLSVIIQTLKKYNTPSGLLSPISPL